MTCSPTAFSRFLSVGGGALSHGNCDSKQESWWVLPALRPHTKHCGRSDSPIIRGSCPSFPRSLSSQSLLPQHGGCISLVPSDLTAGGHPALGPKGPQDPRIKEKTHTHTLPPPPPWAHTHTCRQTHTHVSAHTCSLNACFVQAEMDCGYLI